MTTSLLNLQTLEKPIFWVDYHDYAKKILNHGQTIDWNNVGEVLQFLQQADGLWGSDVIAIDLGDCFDFHMRNNPGLLETMSGKSRLVYALKQFLASPSLIDNVDQILQACVSAFANKQIVLKAPSLHQLIVLCNQCANDVSEVDVDERSISSAAMQFAGFLRNYAEYKISALVIDATGQNGANDISCIAQHEDFVMPIANLLEHYQWALGAIVNDVEQSGLNDLYQLIISQKTQGMTLNVTENQATEEECNDFKLHYMRLAQATEPEDTLKAIASHRELI